MGFHTGVCPGMLHAEGSMRKIYQILFPVLFLFLVLPVIIMPPPLSEGSNEIIPTRNLFAMCEFPSDIHGENEANPALPSSSAMSDDCPVPAGFIMPDENMALQSLSTSNKPMGKGRVQVNLYSSVESPTEMIEDRQRYMASGLFNVHVHHNFAG